MIHEAMEFHIDEMWQVGEPVPGPTTLCAVTEVDVPSTSPSNVTS
jgi:hypothetical protein